MSHLCLIFRFVFGVGYSSVPTMVSGSWKAHTNQWLWGIGRVQSGNWSCSNIVSANWTGSKFKTAWVTGAQKNLRKWCGCKGMSGILIQTKQAPGFRLNASSSNVTVRMYFFVPYYLGNIACLDKNAQLNGKTKTSKQFSMFYLLVREFKNFRASSKIFRAIFFVDNINKETKFLL